MVHGSDDSHTSLYADLNERESPRSSTQTRRETGGNMQFYLNGYKPGDPDILTAELPDAVDVLIVGSGPAGALLAAQLSTFPGISTRLVERRDGPLQVGQADGVACRTVEMFEAFGLSAEARPRGLLGQRDRLLAPVAGRPLADRAHRSHPGHRGRPVGVPARHREPGPPAAVPARLHAQCRRRDSSPTTAWNSSP